MPSSRKNIASVFSDKLIDITSNTLPSFSPESMGLSIESDSKRLFSMEMWGAERFQAVPANAVMNSSSIPLHYAANRHPLSPASNTQDTQILQKYSATNYESIATPKNATGARTTSSGSGLGSAQSAGSIPRDALLILAGYAPLAKSTVDPKQIHVPSPAPESPVEITLAKVSGAGEWLTPANRAYFGPRDYQDLSVSSTLFNWDLDPGTSSLLDCSSPMSCWGDITSVSSEPTRLCSQLPSTLPEYSCGPMAAIELGGCFQMPQRNVDYWTRSLAASGRMQCATSDAYARAQPQSAPTPKLPDTWTVSLGQEILGRCLYDLGLEKLLSCPFDDTPDCEYDDAHEGRPRFTPDMVPVLENPGIHLTAVSAPHSNHVVTPASVYTHTRAGLAQEGKIRKRTRKSPRAKPRVAAASTEPPYNCPQCDKSFQRQEHLKRHSRLVHSTIRPHICPQCGKGFLRSDNLSQHIKTHEKQNAALAPLKKETKK